MTQIVLLLQGVYIFVYKIILPFVFPFVYIKRARCISLIVVIVIFNNIQKAIVLRNVFIYTKSKESILFTYGFVFQAQILRTLLSNENGILHL